MKFLVKGMPPAADKIELPNIGEFLVLPMYGRVSADDLYKYGGETYRLLLNNAPLQNDRKYVIVMAFTQLLYPEVRSIPAATLGETEEDFHIDACEGFDDIPDRNHILLSDCTARTEFNSVEFEAEVPDVRGMEMNAWITRNWRDLGIVPKKIESGRFYTFDTHIHRPTAPEGYELRMIFRVSESDRVPPLPYEQATYRSHFVSKAFYGWDERYLNIKQEEDRVTLYTKLSSDLKL